MVLVLLNLEDIELQISSTINEGAAVVYWQHLLNNFRYLQAKCNADYESDLKFSQRVFRDRRCGMNKNFFSWINTENWTTPQPFALAFRPIGLWILEWWSKYRTADVCLCRRCCCSYGGV